MKLSKDNKILYGIQITAMMFVLPFFVILFPLITWRILKVGEVKTTIPATFANMSHLVSFMGTTEFELFSEKSGENDPYPGLFVDDEMITIWITTKADAVAFRLKYNDETIMEYIVNG